MADEIQRILDSTHGRVTYIITIILIFTILNPILNFSFEIMGIAPQTQVSTHEYVNGHLVQGIKFNIFAYWYISQESPVRDQWHFL